MEEGLPQKIRDKDNIYTLKSFKDGFLFFTTAHAKSLMTLHPVRIEKYFEILDRPTPKAKIIKQGKYECAAASLAMLLNKPLFDVKRALVKHGWNNDNKGCTSEAMVLAAREFGIDLLPIEKKHLKPGIGPVELCVPSLNYSGRSHAVVWNGEEILDPNYGYDDRKVYSSGWAPWTIDAQNGMLVLKKNLTDGERKTLDKLMKRHKWSKLRAWVDKFIKRNGGLGRL